MGLIESKRLPLTRLGYAVQLTTLLFIGRFLADPTDVPTEVVDYLAEQLDIADPSCVKDYRVREMTRLEHATQIRDAYGFVEFTAAAEELARWVDDRAWTTGDGPKALFDGAVVWLREHRVLLPGVSTLARLVARVRDAAMRPRTYMRERRVPKTGRHSTHGSVSVRGVQNPWLPSPP